MKYNVAVVGATGVVGTNMLKILHERKFPVKNVYAVASRDSIGKEVSFGDEDVLCVEAVDNFDFKKVDIALFSAGSEVSKRFAPIAAKAGCIVIDNTSYFRTYKNIPLVVPEVNKDQLKGSSSKIIANPNCVAIPLAIALNPLHKKFGAKRVVISTYQSVSGAGKDAMDELFAQTKNVYTYQDKAPNKLPRRIAFNVIPQVDQIDADGFTKEETKIRNEIKKIFADPSIETVATCVRVPVFISHSISATMEFKKDVSISKVVDELKKTPGIVIADEKDANKYSTPIDIAGKDKVYVSRVRKDPSAKNSICIWIVADNLRKGAALNAIQIAELVASPS